MSESVSPGTTAAPPHPVLILCTDLLFSTKITGTAKALGKPFVVLRSTEKLQQHLAANAPPALLIVDLNAGGPDPMEAIRLAKAHTVTVVAYLSHVQADVAEAARNAGADHVMARSAFVLKLPSLFGNP